MFLRGRDFQSNPGVESLRRFRIGTRLVCCFGLLIALISAGGLVSVWQLLAYDRQASVLDVSSQEVIAILQVNNDVLAFKQKLQLAINGHNSAQLRQLRPLQRFFLRDVNFALRVLESPHERPEDHTTAISMMNLFKISIPDDIEILQGMADTGDWHAVELRLRNQISEKCDMMAEVADHIRERSQVAREISLAENVAAKRRAFLVLALFGLVTAAAGITLGGMVTRSIASPLRELESCADALGEGNFAYRVPVSGHDELSTLAYTFNDAAARIDRSYLELEQRVAERTIELEGATRIAEEASRTKGQFLANMSHEIRTPMNGILGMTELALDTDLTAEQGEYLRAVKSSGDALLTLINDILDFSRIEAGRLSIDPVPCDLRTEIADAVKALAIRAAQKKLEVLFRVSPEVPRTVLIDTSRLRQVLINLIGNAIKFTAAGHVAVTVERLQQEGEGQSSLRFSVRDTGIGIAPDKVSSVFEAFVQADGSVTRLYGGTGLGLAICSQLVRLMGGEIWVESTVGQGSSFFFTLACEELPTTRDEQNQLLSGLRVLVVDDNAVNGEILAELVDGFGMRHVNAQGAEQAIELARTAALEKNPFAFVLMDAHMPEASGFQAAERMLKEQSANHNIVMMLSSASLNEDAGKSRLLGIENYIVKPVCEKDLRTLFLEMLGVAKVTNLAAAPYRTGDALRILVAEDNPVNRKLVSRVLEKQGHVAICAHDGLEAVEAIKNQNFDLILMDVQMPRMGGFEAAAAIRQLQSAAGNVRTPIIALTAHAMKGDEERCLEGGMDGYLSKPLRTDELQAMLEKWAPLGVV